MSTFDRDSFRVWSCSMKLVGATFVRFPTVAPLSALLSGVPLRIHGQGMLVGRVFRCAKICLYETSETVS